MNRSIEETWKGRPAISLLLMLAVFLSAFSMSHTAMASSEMHSSAAVSMACGPQTHQEHFEGTVIDKPSSNCSDDRSSHDMADQQCAQVCFVAVIALATDGASAAIGETYMASLSAPLISGTPYPLHRPPNA